MKKAFTCLLILIQLYFVANAQRSIPRRPLLQTQTHPVFRPLIRIHRRSLRTRYFRSDWRKQEIIQSDTLNIKPGE